MKKILIIDGHPSWESYCASLVKAYQKGAQTAGAEVKTIIIRDLQFTPNLKSGYHKRTELEPDLLQAWEIIQWADHMVWVHPVWWGGLPAISKGFIDRLFLPGMAFQYRENSVWWDKLLKGKTGHIITTLDTPGIYYRIMFGRPSINQLKKSVLHFCGVKPVKVTYISPIRKAELSFLEKHLRLVEALGKDFR